LQLAKERGEIIDDPESQLDVDDDAQDVFVNSDPPAPLNENDKDYISHDRFLAQLNGGARQKHAPIQNQSLEWAGGVVFCKCCGNQRVSQLKNLFRHTQYETHKKRLASFVGEEDVEAPEAAGESVKAPETESEAGANDKAETDV
jgi:hypothetical protein